MTEGSDRGELAVEALEAMPDVVARLETRRRARVADLGCGEGEAGVAIADEFIDVVVDGFDSDPACLAEARRRAADAGLDARVRFHEGGAAALAGQGHYDLILALGPEQPLEDLAPIRDALADDGVLLLARNPGHAEVEKLRVEQANLTLFRLST